MELFAKWNQWVGERLFLVTVIPLILGFMIPISDIGGLKSIIIGLFSYMTFVTALNTSLKDFFKAFTKPLIPTWILIIIHVLSPMLAWVIGNALFPEDSLTRLGLLIGASIPMAVTSLIWTSLAKGNVAVTLVAMTMDTIIVPFWLPAFLKLVVGHVVMIDFKSMLFDLLLMVTLPSLVGMLICDLTKRRMDRFANSIGGFSSKLSLAAVIFINAIIISPAIKWDFHIIKILIAILLSVIGCYFLGYLGSLLFKEKSLELTTSFVYSVGMRNISFGAVLAIAYFPPAVAVPLSLMMLYQQPVAAIVAQILKKARYEGKENELNI